MALIDLDYSGLEGGGLRLAAMIEAEVRALLADNASIRQSGALLFAGDVANIGSDAITLRFAGLDGYAAMASASDGADVSASQLEASTATITVARQALRYDMTDLANLSGLGADLSPFRLAESMVGAFEARFMELVTASFGSFSSSVGTSGVDMSIDDFLDAVFQLELANNPNQIFAVLHPRQVADLQASIRNEAANAIAFNPASHDMLKMMGQGYVGDFLGVQIHKSSYVAESAGNKQGAMFSAGAIAYAIGTPAPMVGAGGEVRPAGTPIVVEYQRDASKGLTEIIGTAYCGAGIVEQARGVLIETDA
jgi:hypothetical protein